MLRVLLTHHLTPAAEERLAARAEIVRAPDAAEATLCTLVADCDALVARTHARINAAVLAAGKRLRVVGVAGVGLENVDLDAAKARGVAVVNVPGAATDAVADLTLLLMLMLLRPVPRLQDAYRGGAFAVARQAPHGQELAELTVGIVGMGRIGSAVGRRLAACGAQVLYNDIIPVGPFDFPCRSVSKEELWPAADILTFHTPLTPATRGLVNAAVLAQCRPQVRLINTSRGAVLDTPALVTALHAGRIAGVGLDVTDPEPLPPEHPLLHDPRCVVTPHIASRTTRGMERMCAVVDTVLAQLDA